jgi:hypothetical protein
MPLYRRHKCLLHLLHPAPGYSNFGTAIAIKKQIPETKRFSIELPETVL